MKPRKICYECANWDQSKSIPGCNAPENNIGMLIGEYIPRRRLCVVHRDNSWIVARMLHTCGKEGRWWKPKGENDDKTRYNI